MQLNGIGNEHTSNTHHATNCMHNHAHFNKIGDINAGASAAAKEVSRENAVQDQADAQFSLSVWLEKTLKSGGRFLRGIWGGDAGAAGQLDTGQVLAQTGSAGDGSGRNADPAGQNSPGTEEIQNLSGRLHAPQIAAAATALQQPRDLRNNPYFSAVEKQDVRQGNLWQRVKVKFKNMAGQLTGHLPGKFFQTQARGSSQSGKEKPKEDLRRRSKFRRDELEIDCVLTDDSYLLDSYDRKGEYSQLSVKK